MFSEQTYDAIKERMLNNTNLDIDKREGSILHDFISPVAVELAKAYIEMENILNLFSMETSYEEYLDKKANEFGLTRKLGTKATGTVIVTGVVGTTILSGTIIVSETDLRFIVTEEYVLQAGNNSINIEAEEVGSAYNLTSGISFALAEEEELEGIESITNTSSFEGGVDTESDDDLRDRLNYLMQNPPTSGNVATYVKLATDIDGIKDARPYPRWNGVNTIKLVLLSTDRRSPSASKIQEVVDYIEENRPIGADVTVEGVSERSIDIAAVLTLVEGTNIDDTKADIEKNVTEYFQSIAFNDNIVRWTKIVETALKSTGVIDVQQLTINNVSSNIQLNYNEVAVVGAITIT